MTEPTKERIIEFRALATELFSEANVEVDLELRGHLVDAANACERIADRLERLADPQAIEQILKAGKKTDLH